MNIDEQIRESFKDLPEPLYDNHIAGVSLWIWKDFKVEFDVCETFPYRPDGEIPLIFIRLGWVEIAFNSKLLYKYLYRFKLGYYPGGLE